MNKGMLCATNGKKRLLYITVLLHFVCIIQHSGVTWNIVPKGIRIKLIGNTDMFLITMSLYFSHYILHCELGNSFLLSCFIVREREQVSEKSTDCTEY